MLEIQLIRVCWSTPVDIDNQGIETDIQICSCLSFGSFQTAEISKIDYVFSVRGDIICNSSPEFFLINKIHKLVSDFRNRFYQRACGKKKEIGRILKNVVNGYY